MERGLGYFTNKIAVLRFYLLKFDEDQLNYYVPQLRRITSRHL
jgi:hypothetical protein